MRIAVISVGRSDYSLYYPVLDLLRDCSSTVVVAGGGHLLASHGSTIDAIREDGFTVVAVPHAADEDSSVAVAASMGAAVSGFADALARIEPDLVLVLGDRFEMFAATAAAYTLKCPIAHLHGGEATWGALDDGYRHAMTKLSHLHFPATRLYGDRIMQMGEESWRVHVVGSPAIDALRIRKSLSRETLRDRIGIEPLGAILMTYHPQTLGSGDREGLEAILAALDVVPHPVVITAPNADPGNKHIRDRLDTYVAARRGRCVLVNSLGREAYPALLACAAAMIGNSSSALIEAPTFALPAVNVGSRQEGRVRGANVIDADPDVISVTNALARSLSAEFRERIRSAPNPYGDGSAAFRIVEAILKLPPREELLRKRFVDVQNSP